MYFVNLLLVKDNPYQSRTNYDPVYLSELAQNILGLIESRPQTKGLLQVPSGRLVDENGQAVKAEVLAEITHDTDITDLLKDGGMTVQIAFGHCRLEAFGILAEGSFAGFDPDERFGAFPVFIQDFSDEEMAITGFLENSEREDLTPIEAATAIEAMMSGFDWTQEKVAERLHISRSKVSNLVRLLALPDDWKVTLAEGEISERQAAAILPGANLPQPAKDRARAFGRTLEHLLVLAKNGASSDKLRTEIDDFVKSGTMTFVNSKGFVEVPLREAIMDDIGADRIVRETCVLEDKKGEDQCEFLMRHKAVPVCANPTCFRAKHEAMLRAILAGVVDEIPLPIVDPADIGDRYNRGEVTFFQANNSADENFFDDWLATAPACVALTATTGYPWNHGPFRDSDGPRRWVKYCCTKHGSYCNEWWAFRNARLRGETPPPPEPPAEGERDDEGDQGESTYERWMREQAEAKELRERDRAEVREKVLMVAIPLLGKAIETAQPGAWRLLTYLLADADERAATDWDKIDLAACAQAIARRIIFNNVLGTPAEENMGQARELVGKLLERAEVERPWAKEAEGDPDAEDQPIVTEALLAKPGDYVTEWGHRLSTLAPHYEADHDEWYCPKCYPLGVADEDMPDPLEDFEHLEYIVCENCDFAFPKSQMDAGAELADQGDEGDEKSELRQYAEAHLDEHLAAAGDEGEVEYVDAEEPA